MLDVQNKSFMNDIPLLWHSHSLAVSAIMIISFYQIIHNRGVDVYNAR